MTLTTRIVQSAGWLLLAPVLVVAALILAGTWVAKKVGEVGW